MSSNLRVDRILPSTGTEVGVGTATGSVALYGDVNVAGTLTYEDVTNIDSVGVITARSDIYLGNDIYLTDGSSGYEKVEVDSNDIRVTGKHIHSEFGVWTRSASVNNRRVGIDADNNDLLLYASSAEKVRIKSSGNVGIGTDNPIRRLHVQSPGSISNALFGNSANNNSIEVTRTGSTASYFQVQTYTNICNIVGGPTLAFRTSDPIGSASTERFRITSDGKVSIGFNAPAVAGLSISNDSTNRGFEFDTGSGFDSTSCIRAYDRPTTAYKSLGLSGSDIKFGINDVEKVRISSGGIAINKNAAADAELEIVQSADPTIRLHDDRNAAYKADFMMAGSAPLIRNNNTTASNRTLTVQKGTTDHLVIEGNGAVRKPLSPSFSANLSSGNLNAATHNNVIIFNNEHFDNGNNYDPSNGRFTASVAGKYYFGVQIYCGFGSGAIRVMHAKFRKNGNDVANVDLFGGTNDDGGTSFHPTGCGHFLTDLAVGDYVDFHSGTISYTGSGHRTIYASNGTRFFGYLVG